MFCPNCGVENPDGSAFCRSCGQSLSEDAKDGHVSDFSGTSSPTPDYEALGASYQTPQTVAADSRRGRRGIGGVLALLTVLIMLGAGAFFLRGVWMPLLSGGANQESPAQATLAEPTTNDDGTASQTNASDQVAGTESASAPSDSDMVGTWIGELRGKSTSKSYCYGAQVQPLVLNVKSEDGAGKIKADITVCYHNHAMGENDIDSDPNDTAVTFSDVTLTNYGGNMEYHGDVSSINQDGSVAVVFHVKGSVLNAEVRQSWVDPTDGKTKFECLDAFNMKLS